MEDDFLSWGDDEPADAGPVAAPAVHDSKSTTAKAKKSRRSKKGAQQLTDEDAARLEKQYANVQDQLETLQEEHRAFAKESGENPNDVHAQLDEFFDWDKAVNSRDSKYNLIKSVFPDEDVWGRNPETGAPFIMTHAREKYGPHMKFFATKHPRRLFRAANRSGKTYAGAYETALHATGRYDEYAPWWPGFRLTNPMRPNGTLGPIEGQIIGVSADSMIRTVQKELIGNPAVNRKDPSGSGNAINGDGTGLIPRDRILGTIRAAGVPMGVSTVLVEHTNAEGMPTLLHFKASEAGAGKLAGTTRSLFWGDEEIDLAVYSESLQRLATTQGISYITVTPLHGLTPLMIHLDPSVAPGGDDRSMQKTI